MIVTSYLLASLALIAIVVAGLVGVRAWRRRRSRAPIGLDPAERRSLWRQVGQWRDREGGAP